MASISEVQQVRVHGSRRSPSVGISSQNSGTKRRPCIVLIVHQRLHVCCIFVSFIPVWVWLKHAIPYAPQHRGFTMVSSHVTLPSLKQRQVGRSSNTFHPNRCASPNRECEPKGGDIYPAEVLLSRASDAGAHRLTYIYNSLLPLFTRRVDALTN
jgi:hypothetical protein